MYIWFNFMILKFPGHVNFKQDYISFIACFLAVKIKMFRSAYYIRIKLFLIYKFNLGIFTFTEHPGNIE